MRETTTLHSLCILSYSVTVTRACQGQTLDLIREILNLRRKKLL
jgi:hypothetical protein